MSRSEMQGTDQNCQCVDLVSIALPFYLAALGFDGLERRLKGSCRLGSPGCRSPVVRQLGVSRQQDAGAQTDARILC